MVEWSGVGAVNEARSPFLPEKAMAGICWSTAKTAAPTVPEKGSWTSRLVPTFGPVRASSGLAPFQRAGAVTSMPFLIEVTGNELT